MPNYYPWSCAICWTTYTLVRIVLVDLSKEVEVTLPLVSCAHI